MPSSGCSSASATRAPPPAGSPKHYRFGSTGQLFEHLQERFTNRLIGRQRAMHAADRPSWESGERP